MAQNQYAPTPDTLRERLAWFEGARGGEGNIPKPEFDDAGKPLNETAQTIYDLRARIGSLSLN